jgi:hypothetical protein
MTVINDPPALQPIAARTLRAGETTAFLINARDPEGDAVTYRARSLPGGATFDASLAFFEWTPVASQLGAHTVIFEATDGLATTTRTAIITVSGVAPTPTVVPGWSWWGAAYVAPGTYSNLFCDRSHWFKVTLGSPRDLTVRIDFRHSEGDLDLIVYGPRGTVGTSDGVGGDSEQVSRTAQPAGTYYIRVYGYRGAKAGYTLTIR